MARRARSCTSPKTQKQRYHGVALVVLCLLIVVDKTNSQDDISGKPRFIMDMENILKNMNEVFNERLTTIENSLTDITRVIKYMRRDGFDSSHENFRCQHPYMTPISSDYPSQQCIVIYKHYATYKEATDTCTAVGGHLAIIKHLKKLGNSLVEKDALAKYTPNTNSILSHNTFWVGALSAGSQSTRNRLSWVDGNPVYLPYTRFNGSATTADRDQPVNLCGALQLDLYGDDHKLVAKSCDEPWRYPFLCEFDVGSDFLGEAPHDYKRTCPRDFYWELSTGECIYLSPFNETLSYDQAVDFCVTKGGALMHPRKISSLMERMNEFHNMVKQEKDNKKYYPRNELSDEDQYLVDLEEYGVWINKSFRNDDQEWDDSTPPDMCISLEGRMAKREVFKGFAECSSSRQFICSLNMRS